MLRILVCTVLLHGIRFHAEAQNALPPNMYADTAHAPFLWGVASGDPLPDGVVLWTRPDPELTNGEPQIISYEVALDEDFTEVVATGTVEATAETHHCTRVEVDGLSAATTYFYRFTSGQVARSAVGRTRTAPDGNVDLLRFAVASCSSVYSGYFNAYRRIAERDDIDLLIHLGDYIYDFVDGDEEIRVPNPYPSVPDSEDEWRELHLYHLLDPDLRAARQMHPWMILWDNHDFEGQSGEGVQAFYEFVPRRDVHDDIGKIHRTLRFGDLVDLTMIDIEKFRNIDTIAPGEASVLTDEQRMWFLGQLGSSTAKWKINGSQKMFGGWYSDGVPTWIPVPNDGEVFDRGSWDGFMAERDTILRFIEENDIDNFMMLAGDVHMSFAIDLSRSPKNGSVYDPATGNGSIGVEFIPTSISRGNFDEAGVPAFVVPTFEGISQGINPHHRYAEFVQHGYGILNIDHDSIVAEWWYVPILQQTGEQTLAHSMTVGDRQNRWKRPGGFAPLGVNDASEESGIDIYPNPNDGLLHVHLSDSKLGNCPLRIMDSGGREVLTAERPCSGAFTVDTSPLSSGSYILDIQGKRKQYRRTFIME